MLNVRLIPVGLFLMLACSCNISKQPYIAYSLREAQRLSREGNSKNHELAKLGGMTRIVGMVHDRQGKDVILVGRKVDGQAEALLNDLVVALRARLLFDEWPLVSIDPTKTGRQEVNFRGRIADTQFGMDFLNCDIILKKYSLELLTPVDAVQSYKTLCVNNIKNQIKAEGAEVVGVHWLSPDSARKLQGKSIQAEENLQTRFWFYPLEPTRFVAREGVFCIKELRLGVMSELDYANKNEPASLQSSGEAFAKQFTENFQSVTSTHPLLKRLKVLYDLVAVAEGIKNLQDRPDFTYLLKQYEMPAVLTPKEHDLIQLFALVERSDGIQHALQISGGIEFSTELKWLNYGDVTPLRDICFGAGEKRYH